MAIHKRRGGGYWYYWLVIVGGTMFVIAYYAILRADAMVVPINPMLMTKEVGHIVQDSGATALFAAQDGPGIPSLSRIQPLIGNGLSHVIVACYSDYLTAVDYDDNNDGREDIKSC